MSNDNKTFDFRQGSLSNESVDFLDKYEDELEIQGKRIAEEKGFEGEEELDTYISYLNNVPEEYIVDGALLACTKGTNEVKTIKYDGKTLVSKVGAGKENSRISIFKDRKSKINGLVPVTVEDCKGGFRDDTGEGVNIVSFGNCGFLYDGENINQLMQERGKVRKPMLEEVEKALEEGKGTCYCFMDLEKSWENMPYDVMGQMNGSFNYLSAGVSTVLNGSYYLEFDKKEGINRMSMLFCKLGGGCIMALESGQNCNNVEERIQLLIAGIEGRKVNSFQEICGLPTVEILARLLYQESRSADNKGQDAVLFSIVNRLFSEENFLRGTASNSLYSIITGKNQYESIINDRKKYPNAFYPPAADTNYKTEKKAWENAKRLAAILCIALEDYGNINDCLEEGEPNENVVNKGDQETYQKIVEFITQQQDINGENIINEIETRESFNSTDYYNNNPKGKEPLEVGGNTFFWE